MVCFSSLVPAPCSALFFCGNFNRYYEIMYRKKDRAATRVYLIWAIVLLTEARPDEKQLRVK